MATEKTKRDDTTVKIDREVARDAATIAKARGQSLAEFVTEIVRSQTQGAAEAELRRIAGKTPPPKKRP